MNDTPKGSTITISALAKRWQVSHDRISSMVEAGLIPGAFRIRSAGRFGTVVRIPFASVVELEQQWQVGTVESVRSRVKRRPALDLRHFPELQQDGESSINGES